MKRLFITLLFFIMFIVTSGAQETVQLRWSKSTDNIAVTGYNIWLEDELFETTVDTFLIVDLEPGTYSFKVSAFDAEGNESPKSAPYVIEVIDTLLPSTPEEFTIRKRGFGDLAMKPEEEYFI